MIQCSVCQKSFRHLCVNLTLDELKILNDSDKGYSWSCINCRVIGNQINDLKNLIMSLQSELKSLRAERTDGNNSSQSFDFEDIIEEMNDRNSRKKNLIIFGIPEQNQDDPPQNRSISDKNEVTNLLKIVDSTFDANKLKPTRIGRYKSNHIRPIKLILETENEVVNLMKNAKSLRNSTYRKAFISLDRTPRQLNHFKSLKAQLDQMNNQGNEKFVIKYFSGTPKIVKSSN